MDIIITYETIYDLLRKEKYKPELQPLDKTFFKDITTYLKEKQEILESQSSKDTFQKETEKTEKQIQNIKRLLKELYEKREGKIIQLAIFASKLDSDQDIDAMLPEEKQLYDALVSILKSFKGNILDNILNGKMPVLEEPKVIKSQEIKKNKLIRFIQAVPKFVGTDLNNYGPYEIEDIANLPIEIADVIIKGKRAEEI